MGITESIKKVWKGVLTLLEFVWAITVLYDLVTNRRILAFLSSAIGYYGTIIYDLLIALVLFSFAFVLFWLGHRYYDSVLSKVRKSKKLKEQKPSIHEGIEFFSSREELRKKHPLASFLSQANHRIVLLGGSLETIVVQNRNTIKKTLEKGILIEFLVQNPDWITSVGLDKATVTTLSISYKDGIKRSLGTLCSIMSELGASNKNKCAIKTYQIHATHSGIAIDPEHPEGKILVELYPYGTQSESRPSFLVHRKENEALFETWWQSFGCVLATAKEYVCHKEVEEPKEVVSKQESRKQSIISPEVAYSNLTKKFNRALKAVEETSDPEIKALMLDGLYDGFRDLCYNYEWEKVKGEVEKVLDYAIIPEKLFGDPNAKKYVQFLTVIISRFGEQVTDAISKKWLRELDRFYNDSNYDKSSLSNLIFILLQLHGNSKDYIMKLIDDAATRWSEREFQVLQSDLGIAFNELKKRDELAYEEITSYLRRKMEDAKQHKEASYNRLYQLFEMANK
jgi:hypothetical protein